MRIFYSYAHVDEKLRTRLEVSLSELRQSGLISDWSDRKILAGCELDENIRKELETADIILLLVSPDFVASSYIRGVELAHAMKRHASGEARVIPIILRPTVLEGLPFMKLICLPRDAKAVTKWPNRDEAFKDIAEGIARVVKEMTETRAEQAKKSGAADATPDRWAAPTEWISAQRYLDAGVAKEIALGESREVRAWIRRLESKSLGDFLVEVGAQSAVIQDEYTLGSADIITTKFTVLFPVASEGLGRETQILRLKVELVCPGLQIADSPAIVRIPRESDSQLVTFLVRNNSIGRQALKMRVICDDEEIVSVLLRTNFVAHGGPGDKGPSGGVMRMGKNEAGQDILVLTETWLHVDFVALTKTANA